MTPPYHQTPRVTEASLQDYSAIVAIFRSTRMFGFLNYATIKQSVERGEINIAHTPTHIIAGFIRFHPRKDGTTTIYDLYVVPQYRRHPNHYGTALFDSIPRPKQLRCPNAPKYAPAHAFYTSFNPTTRTSDGPNLTLYTWRHRPPT